jgi:hypothetical protein
MKKCTLEKMMENIAGLMFEEEIEESWEELGLFY